MRRPARWLACLLALAASACADDTGSKPDRGPEGADARADAASSVDSTQLDTMVPDAVWDAPGPDLPVHRDAKVVGRDGRVVDTAPSDVGGFDSALSDTNPRDAPWAVDSAQSDLRAPDAAQIDAAPAPDISPPPPDLGPPDTLVADAACSSATQCDDSLSCTTDSCTGGRCVNNPNQGWCVVGGKCITRPCVMTWAGSSYGYADGPALLAKFHHPTSVSVSAAGDVYVADMKNHRIRLIRDGWVSTFAGSGRAGLVDGPKMQAQFNYPGAVAVSSTGDVYVTEYNHTIRLIRAGVVSTAAGTGSAGFKDGPAASAEFNQPAGMLVVGSKLYIADTLNHRIRLLESGSVTTFAGSGTAGSADGPSASAQFSSPTGLAVDSSGAIYVADFDNHRIRRIAAGQVTTVAGSTRGYQDGPLSSARFVSPAGVSFGGSSTSDLFVTESLRVRRITASNVSTVAGGSNAGLVDGPASTALFSGGGGFPDWLQGKGLLVPDTGNSRIRLVVP